MCRSDRCGVCDVVAPWLTFRFSRCDLLNVACYANSAHRGGEGSQFNWKLFSCSRVGAWLCCYILIDLSPAQVSKLIARSGAPPYPDVARSDAVALTYTYVLPSSYGPWPRVQLLHMRPEALLPSYYRVLVINKLVSVSDHLTPSGSSIMSKSAYIR